MSYNKITNPKTGETVSIYGKEGNSVLNGYFNYLIKNETILQTGGENTNTPDASFVTNSYFRNQRLLSTVRSLTIYTDQDTSLVAPAYNKLLETAVKVESNVSDGEIKFWAEIIRQLIIMCGGKMTLYKKNGDNYTPKIYDLDDFNKAIMDSNGDENTKLIPEFYILTSDRKVHTDYSFKTIYDKLDDMIKGLESSLNSLKDKTSSKHNQTEIEHVEELNKYLKEWKEYIEQEGAKLTIE